MTSLPPLFAALVLAASPAAAAPQTPAMTAEAPTGDIIIANVNGLVCDFCAQSIRKLFGDEPAVSKVHVDLDKGVVRLTMKQGQTMDDAAIEKLIRRAGYSLVSLDRNAAK